MRDTVRALLEVIRQHPDFPELVVEMDALLPRPPRFKAGTSTEQFGAETLFVSGKRDQHQKLIEFLTGQPSQLKE